MVFRLGVRRYVIDSGSRPAGLIPRRPPQYPRIPSRDSRPPQFQLLAEYATRSELRSHSSSLQYEPSTNTEDSTGGIGTADSSSTRKAIESASKTSKTQSKWEKVGGSDDIPQKQNWLSWNFDASVPSQVRLCGWALKVLDIVDGVSENDAAELEASLQRYSKIMSADNSSMDDAQHIRAEMDLIHDFREVWYRSEERFKSASEKQDDNVLSAHDLNLRKEVSEILQQLDTSSLDEQVPSHCAEGSQLSENLTDPAGALRQGPESSGANSITGQSNQQDHQEYSAPSPGRFVPEGTEQWLRRRRKEKEIAKADSEAKVKCA